MPDLHLVDSSAWIEWIRGTGSAAHLEVRRLLREDLGSVTITGPIAMELLAGARTPAARARLEQLTAGLRPTPFDPDVDFHHAAGLARAMRAAGTPVRSMVDCLIAAVAVRTGVVVLHRDRDFDALAAVGPELRVRALR